MSDNSASSPGQILHDGEFHYATRRAYLDELKNKNTSYGRLRQIHAIAHGLPVEQVYDPTHEPKEVVVGPSHETRFGDFSGEEARLVVQAVRNIHPNLPEVARARRETPYALRRH